MFSLGGNCAPAFHLKRFNKREYALPFDWCKMNVKMLILVLQNDFQDYELFESKKISDKHISFNEDLNYSLLLKNKYGIEFAHELKNSSEIDNFKLSLKKRIERFKNLKNPKFIRLETKNLSSEQIKIYSILELELKKLFQNFKLKLISKSKYQSEFVDWIELKNFDSDWKFNSLNWKNILS